MATKYETHSFYCINCGNKSYDLPRKKGRLCSSFHRKKLYCPHCKNTINNIECKTIEEVEKFKEEFKRGVYKDEAKESLAYIRDSKQW